MRLHLPNSLVDAVSNREKVTGAPHDFYKYPARFSPIFAREAIKCFTRPGDFVLDPFCGGGTTLVEAISLGRRTSWYGHQFARCVPRKNQDNAHFCARQTRDKRMARQTNGD